MATSEMNCLKFYASVRLDIRKIGSVPDGASAGADVIGSRVRVKVVKNKVAPPFREAEFELLFASGIDCAGELLDLAVRNGLVVKRNDGCYYAGAGNHVGMLARAREWALAHESIIREHITPLAKEL